MSIGAEKMEAVLESYWNNTNEILEEPKWVDLSDEAKEAVRFGFTTAVKIFNERSKLK